MLRRKIKNEPAPGPEVFKLLIELSDPSLNAFLWKHITDKAVDSCKYYERRESLQRKFTYMNCDAYQLRYLEKPWRYLDEKFLKTRIS